MSYILRTPVVFLSPPRPPTWSETEKKKLFYSWANFNFVLYRSSQAFLNAYIPAQQNILLSDIQLQDSLKTNFLCTMLLIKVLPLSHMQHYKH